MAIDRRISNKVAKSYRKEDSPGLRIDPFPYIGIVKNNLDPTRSGRLQVWIPDLGGDPDKAQNWRTVQYASPFMGYTNQRRASNPTQLDKTNAFDHVVHTYGMWMVPPDIGVQVLVLFVGGDPLRGFWIACVNPSITHYMVPGLASSTSTNPSVAFADTKKSLTPGAQYPVTEFNVNDPTLLFNTDFIRNPKPIHEEQFNVLRTQGLDRDTTRGTITSSSQRETPSNVFGISTPGRPYGKDPADDPNFETKIKNDLLTEEDYAYTTRKGGHTFVMDDGSILGKDQLIRLRTSRGHQIMMHDSDNTLYIADADGTVWLELGQDGSGRLDIFAVGSVNIRTQDSINMHADKDININANGHIHMRSKKDMQFNCQSFTQRSETTSYWGSISGIKIKTGASFDVHADTTMSLLSGSRMTLNASIITENSGGGVSIPQPEKIKVNLLPDTLQEDSTLLWKIQPSKLETIVDIAPGHEPYYFRTASVLTGAGASGIKPQQTYSGSQDATKNAAGSGVSNGVTEKDLRAQPEAPSAIGTLSKDQTTALMAQIAKSETGGKADPYGTKNQLGFVGKYQFGAAALKDLGYVKTSASGNSSLENPNSWTGKDGIYSLEDYYKAKDVQEKMAVEYTQRNYNTLVKTGAITASDSPETVGGMLMTSHLLGAGGAKTWRNGGGGADANGTTGETYFQRGKLAVASAPKLGNIG